MFTPLQRTVATGLIAVVLVGLLIMWGLMYREIGSEPLMGR